MNGAELHKQLLKVPHGNKLLYKVMKTEDLMRSISGSYLHFNRVDKYNDQHDGKQLPKDLADNLKSIFRNSKNFSAADYYNQSRSRTYACCFSTENSDYIWNSYGEGGNKGKVCLVFKFSKLRTMLNEIFQNEKAILVCDGIKLKKLFSLNYGLIQYVDWNRYKANTEFLLNPIIYTYFKDKGAFSKEKELRIALSYSPVGQPVVNEKIFEFPNHLHMHFDFGPAIGRGVINKILHSSDCDKTFFYSELERFNIFKKKGRGS
jgi:hypothetical protein